MEQNSKLPPPSRVWEDLTAGWRSLALAAAIDLDLFTHIDAGKHTAAEIAGAAGADARAMGLLCDAMAGLKYLRKDGERFMLEPIADAYLVRGRELYMENQGMLTRGALGAVWSGLPDVVRSGKPTAPQNQEASVGFFRILVKGIFPLSYVAAKAAVAAFSVKMRESVHDILDVAAGSGAWSLPFAQEIPHARVAALDYAPVLEVTREYAERYHVADRYEYIGGDLNELDFGTERYDLVILGQILHGLGRELSRKVIEKSVAALRKKGMILIAEFIANDDRTGPEIPMLFGLNMLVSTPEGDVYTMAELREWLKGAGMKSVKTIRAPMPSPLVLATK